MDAKLWPAASWRASYSAEVAVERSSTPNRLPDLSRISLSWSRLTGWVRCSRTKAPEVGAAAGNTHRHAPTHVAMPCLMRKKNIQRQDYTVQITHCLRPVGWCTMIHVITDVASLLRLCWCSALIRARHTQHRSRVQTRWLHDHLLGISSYRKSLQRDLKLSHTRSQYNDTIIPTSPQGISNMVRSTEIRARWKVLKRIRKGHLRKI